MQGIDYADTYSWDLPLFKKLKLKPFCIEKDGYWKDHPVGRVKDGPAHVDIFVSCCPAQFWKFNIKLPSGKVLYLSTGSGSFSTYWPTIKMFLDDMLVVDND
jgi:hypothetical protein